MEFLDFIKMLYAFFLIAGVSLVALILAAIFIAPKSDGNISSMIRTAKNIIDDYD